MELRFWYGRTQDCEGPYKLRPWVRPLWEFALRGDWREVFNSLQVDNEHSSKPLWPYVNAFCPWHGKHHSFLHLAAEQGAGVEVLERMIEMGAWRSLQNGEGNRPVDIARKAGNHHLVEVLKPRFRRAVPFAVLLEIQHRFHSAIRHWDNLGGRIAEYGLNLPQLQPMLEGEPSAFSFDVFFWGIFNYELLAEGPEPRLLCSLESYIGRGPVGRGRLEITMNEVTKLPYNLTAGAPIGREQH